MEIYIRHATHQNLSSITDILNRAVSHKIIRGDTAWGFECYNKGDIVESIDQGIACIAYTEENQMIGVFTITWEDPGMWGAQPPVAAYLHRLAVAHNFHGQNIGSRIIDAVSAEAAKQNRSFIRLDCPAENTRLGSYYESLGFYRADAKANPTHSRYRAAYFERPTSINQPMADTPKPDTARFRMARLFKHFGKRTK